METAYINNSFNIRLAPVKEKIINRLSHVNRMFATMHLFPREHCSVTLVAFRTARNQYERFLENANNNYAQSVQAKVENKRLSSRELWKISNTKLNRSKMLLPTTITDSNIISCSPDKAMCFVKNFARNFTLDEMVHYLPDFPSFHGAQAVISLSQNGHFIHIYLTQRRLLVWISLRSCWSE